MGILLQEALLGAAGGVLLGGLIGDINFTRTIDAIFKFVPKILTKEVVKGLNIASSALGQIFVCGQVWRQLEGQQSMYPMEYATASLGGAGVNDRITIETKLKRVTITEDGFDYDRVSIDGGPIYITGKGVAEKEYRAKGYSIWRPKGVGMGVVDFAIELALGTRAAKWVGKKIASWLGIGVTKQVLPNSGPIMKSLGGASRAEMLAKKLKMNIDSPTTRQVLNSLDESVESFISKYRKSSIKSEIPGQFLKQTMEDALKSGNTTIRKLLIDTRFVK